MTKKNPKMFAEINTVAEKATSQFYITTVSNEMCF